MSVNLYQTGVSGLLTAQQQLATTGNNISNVNTEGYTRQRAEQSASLSINEGNNFYGTGTFVRDVNRIFSEFTYREQLSNQSNKGSADSFNVSMSQLNDVMNFSGKSIADAIDRFYQSVNSITDNPNDAGLRSITLTEANILTSNIRSLNDNFNQLERSTNSEISEMATRISEISVELSQINDQILRNQKGTNSGQPNGLLDRRDQLVFELGEFTKVNTIQDANGVMTVMIGQGTTLVAGITPLVVNVIAGDPDSNQTRLSLDKANSNSSAALNPAALGGAIAAKFEFRDQNLAQARREIDRLTLAFSETINKGQAEGLDLNQLQGANIFSDINSSLMQQTRVLALAKNTGNLQAQVKITDVSKLPVNDFEIRYNGTDYILTNLNDKSSTNLGAPGAGTYSTAFGFDFIETSGVAATNDVLQIRPNENAAATVAVVMQDGASIAASSAVLVTPSDNNVSAGGIKMVDMLDPVNARNAMPMRIDVLENPPGTFTYTYTDKLNVTSAPVAYTPPSQLVNLPPAPATALFQVEISGTPSGVATNAPEQFLFTDAYGKGNSANALKLALSQEQPILNKSTETFAQTLSVTNAKVGAGAKSADLVSDTANALFTQAFNRNQEISGVNLDEEAANMMKFQQAYRAASQIISVANAIFDTLLAAAR
jgi:flagellar hook-associated protein 1